MDTVLCACEDATMVSVVMEGRDTNPKHHPTEEVDLTLVLAGLIGAVGHTTSALTSALTAAGVSLLTLSKVSLNPLHPHLCL